jgi:predicted metal-dependent peptidase
VDASKKIAAARTRLILDKPFLGALALRLPLEEAEGDWCRSTWSNGTALYYNRGYIDLLDIEQTQFAVSREALHCALLHFYRRGNRGKERWENACDYAVNALLLEDGFKAPPDTLYSPEYRGLTADEIYPLLAENAAPASSPKNENQQDSDTPHPQQQTAQSLSPDEQELLAARWRQRLTAAAQQAQQVGKLSADLARLVEIHLQPKLPWRSLLAQYLCHSARNDYSYTRPSTRRGDPAVFPRLRSEEIELVVAVDTSGSIRESEMAEFFAEINAIKGQVRARISLLCCDAKIADTSPVYFEPWDEFKFEQAIQGGGGTDFRPVFDWVDRQDLQPDTLVYFTDAQGKFPKHAPSYPTLWLVKGKAEVPFGARIQLNE